MKKIAIKLIKIYQQISSKFPRKCKYYPTCSEYTLQAIEKYGFIKGTYKGIKRILRCNPFSKGGYDPLE